MIFNLGSGLTIDFMKLAHTGFKPVNHRNKELKELLLEFDNTCVEPLTDYEIDLQTRELQKLALKEEKRLRDEIRRVHKSSAED